MNQKESICLCYLFQRDLAHLTLIRLVTGAASGIGRGTVENLLKIGCGKIFACDINEKQLQENFGKNEQVICITVDISNLEQVQKAVAIVEQHLPPNEKLFGIVNCAGILCPRYTPIIGVKEEEVERQFKVNVFGMIRMNKNLFPYLQRPNGVIINVSSMSGLGFLPLLGMYPATKYAVRGYSEALRRELALLGIRVVSVFPGGVNTPLSAQLGSQSVDCSEYDFWDSRILEYSTKVGMDTTNSNMPILFMPHEIGFFLSNIVFNSNVKRDIILDKYWFVRAFYYSTYALLPNAISDTLYSLAMKLNTKRKQD